MDQDEKTARGHRGVPVVRATPPVGTPLGPHHAPPSAPATPAKTASQPRTLGGLTARLVTPDEDALLIDPLGSSSLPYDPRPWEAPDSVASIGDLAHAPVSQTVGGTARLQTVSPEEAAAAQRELDLEEKARNAPNAPAPPLADAPQPAAPPSPPVALVASAPASPGAAADDDASTVSLLFAPLSVGVGLVFFAMGSMLTLTIDGRLNMNRAQVVGALTVPAPSLVPPPPTAHPAPSAASTALLPQAPLAPLAPPSVTAASVPLPLSVAPTVKSGAAGASGATSAPPIRSGGGTKKPPLPFP